MVNYPQPPGDVNRSISPDARFALALRGSSETDESSVGRVRMMQAVSSSPRKSATSLLEEKDKAQYGGSFFNSVSGIYTSFTYAAA